MANEQDLIRKWTGIMATSITDVASGDLRPGRPPTTVMIEDNADVEEITGLDGLGRETVVDTNVKGFKPVLTLTYPGANLDLYAMSRGRTVERINLALFLPKQMKIRRSLYPAATTGRMGFGVVKDAVSSAATTDTGYDPIQLTQQPWDTFDATVNNTFAIGENFARKFSDNLVASNQVIDITVPLPSKSVRTVTEDTLGFQSIQIMARSTNDSVTLIDIPSAKINPSGSKLDPKADSLELKFILSGLGVCEPYKVYELTDKVFCDD